LCTDNWNLHTVGQEIFMLQFDIYISFQFWGARRCIYCILTCLVHSATKIAMLLQLHHADWLYLPRKSRPVLVRAALTSSHALSHLLYLLITLAIALAGMATDSDPLRSRRSPTETTLNCLWCTLPNMYSSILALSLHDVVGWQRYQISMRPKKSTQLSQCFLAGQVLWPDIWYHTKRQWSIPS